MSALLVVITKLCICKFIEPVHKFFDFHDVDLPKKGGLYYLLKNNRHLKIKSSQIAIQQVPENHRNNLIIELLPAFSHERLLRDMLIRRSYATRRFIVKICIRD